MPTIETTRHNGDAIVAVTTFFSETELAQITTSLATHLVRRFTDTLYAELLPIMRERVSAKLDAVSIANVIEEEIQMSIHAAFGHE